MGMEVRLAEVFAVSLTNNKIVEYRALCFPVALTVGIFFLVKVCLTFLKTPGAASLFFQEPL